MIVTKYVSDGGGGYVLPAATQSTLGGIKVGAGLDIDSGGTLSVSGGTGGGGDYIVTDALSSITNPTEGMIAYVPFHYEDRGATKAIFTIGDPTQDFGMDWITVVSYQYDSIDRNVFLASYYFHSDNPGMTEYGLQTDFYPRLCSQEWRGMDMGGTGFMRVSGDTIEVIVDSGATGLNWDDMNGFSSEFTTGLTPVMAKTYIYLDNEWLLKDMNVRESRIEEILPSLNYIYRHQGNTSGFKIGDYQDFGAFNIKWDNNFSTFNGYPSHYHFDGTTFRDEVKKFYGDVEYQDGYHWVITFGYDSAINMSGYQQKHWASTPYHAQFLFNYEERESGIFEYKYRTPLPGNQPQTEQTYSDIWFTCPGNISETSAQVKITSGGTDYEINNWGGLMIDGQVYQPYDTLPIDITWEYDVFSNCLHVHGNLEVVEVGGSIYTTVAEPLPAVNYLNATKINESLGVREWVPVTVLNIFAYSGMSQDEMAAAVDEVKGHLWHGVYGGGRTFIVAYSGVSETVMSVGYSEVASTSETLVLKTMDYTATITKDIPNDTYSIVIS